TFKDGTRVLGTAPLVNGVARLTLSNLAPGAHQITASFGGVYHYGASADTTPALLTVGRAAAKDDLTLPTWAVYAGHALTLSARVTTWAASNLVPGGTVTFKDGSTVLGTVHLDSLGRASLALTRGLSRGTHTITAVYSGN